MIKISNAGLALVSAGFNPVFQQHNDVIVSLLVVKEGYEAVIKVDNLTIDYKDEAALIKYCESQMPAMKPSIFGFFRSKEYLSF